jgi:hypothetical protein
MAKHLIAAALLMTVGMNGAQAQDYPAITVTREAQDEYALLFAISWPIGDWIVSILSCQLPLQTEGIVDRMRRLGKPAGAGFGDDHVVLEADAEFAVDADGRLV